MRPRPLTKTQRNVLLKARGDGVDAREISNAEMGACRGLFDHGWMDYRLDGERRAAIYFTTPAGDAKLVELAPSPPEGRLACVNPRCWRTFSKEKNQGYRSIVCGTCYKTVPEIRRERRELNALFRKTERRRRIRGDEKTDEALRRINWQLDLAWSRMVRFFETPEKPEGLETFIEEMGWNAPQHQSEVLLGPAGEGAAVATSPEDLSEGHSRDRDTLALHPEADAGHEGG